MHALPAWANRGCCRISDVIRGDVQWAVLTNYMIDLEWLLSACPILYHVPRVILMHGESGAALERLQVRASPLLLSHNSCRIQKVVVGVWTESDSCRGNAE